MPRRNRPRPSRDGTRAATVGLGWSRVENSGDDEWMVRNVPGSQATKTYRCPGCDHEIRPGVAHVVAWPTDTGGVDDRRHWHSGCWKRGTRA